MGGLKVLSTLLLKPVHFRSSPLLQLGLKLGGLGVSREEG
jgi:hypothetical protein